MSFIFSGYIQSKYPQTFDTIAAKLQEEFLTHNYLYFIHRPIQEHRDILKHGWLIPVYLQKHSFCGGSITRV